MITNGNNATRSANEVRVQLNFTGFKRSPSEVTSQVGVVPAKTWEAGAFIERSKRTYASNGWRVSPGERYEDVERGVDALLSIITPRWDELRSLSCESRVELSIVLYVYESAPAVHLRRDQIARLTELNADIDVDLYCRSSQ